MAGFKLTISKDTSRILKEKICHDIELLCSDGKITANRCFLGLASPRIHKILSENPLAISLNFSYYSREVMNALLHLIYSDEVIVSQKDGTFNQLLELMNNLEIPLKSLLCGMKLNNSEISSARNDTNNNQRSKRKTPPKATCGICSKVVNKSRIRLHILEVHQLTEKNVHCEVHDCDRKFKCQRYMVHHMRHAHGISSRRGKVQNSQEPTLPKSEP
eukprot:11979.XXX_445022_445672_1 [CDS] Oithona nana genome sequencing.